MPPRRNLKRTSGQALVDDEAGHSGDAELEDEMEDGDVDANGNVEGLINDEVEEPAADPHAAGPSTTAPKPKPPAKKPRQLTPAKKRSTAATPGSSGRARRQTAVRCAVHHHAAWLLHCKNCQ